MRSEQHASIREGGERSAGGTALPRDVGTTERPLIATPAALALETADSVFRWYVAMLRLAFGLRRTDGRGEVQGLSAPPSPVKREESAPNSAPHSSERMKSSGDVQSFIASPAPAPPTPSAESSRVAALPSMPTAAVKLRPKRRKTASRGKNKTRSSKISSMKRRHRRAA